MRLLLALILCLIATPAAADRYAMRYEGHALGLAPLGTIAVDAEVSSDRYQVRARLQSSGLLNLFERTNLTAESAGLVRDSGVFWQSYDLDHYYSRKHRATALRVGENGAINATIEPNYRVWGDPAVSDEQKRRSRDPLSTMVAMAVDVSQTHRCAGAYPTFDGRFHYLLELGGGEIHDFDGGGYDGPVLRCTMSYIAVSGFEARDGGRRRIPHGQVWFALIPGATFAPPVRISTPLAAGAATIRLTSFRRAVVDVVDTATAP